jgi:hypothetical protein
MTSVSAAPLQQSSHRRSGARRQGHRVASPPKPRRIVRSRTRDSQACFRGRQRQGRIGGLGRGALRISIHPTPPHFPSRYPHPTIHAIPIGQLNVKLRSQTSSITTKAGKVTVQGSNANVSHTINEDERREFTNHINGVSNNSVSRRARRPMTISTFVDSRRRSRCRFAHPDPHGNDAAVR